MYRYTLLVMLLAACGLNEDKFEEQYAEAYCGWLDGCAKLNGQHGTMDDCIASEKIFADETLTPDSCEFDKEKAKECIAEIEENEDCVIEDSVPNECLEVSLCTAQDTGE